MRTVKKIIVCANCGTEFETEITAAASSRDFGLDGKPDNPGFLPMIYDCPGCGYAGYKIDGDKPAMPTSFNIDRNNPYDCYERALILATSNDVKNHLLMEYAWKLEFDGQNEKARQIRARAVEQMEISLNERPIIELALIYIDFLRQLGRFGEAAETLNSLSSVITADAQKKPRFYKLFLFLKKLTEEHDDKPHMISEV